MGIKKTMPPKTKKKTKKKVLPHTKTPTSATKTQSMAATLERINGLPRGVPDKTIRYLYNIR